MEVVTWHTKSAMLAYLAALAPAIVRSTLFQRAIRNTKSTRAFA